MFPVILQDFRAVTKRRILLGFMTLALLYIGYLVYLLVLSPKSNLQSIYLIPKDAVFVIESEKPVKSWKKIREGDAWSHLLKNNYFAELTSNIQQVDTVFSDQQRVFEFLDNRSLFISIHMISPKDYGVFYVLDLKRIAKLKLLKTYLNTLLNENYTLSKRQYHDHEILEIYDRQSKKTISLSFIKNQMIASYTHSLVEAAIDQYEEPVLGRNLNFIAINEKVGFENLFRLYVQYNHLDDYINAFSDRPGDWVDRISENFLFSGFHFDLDKNNTLTANGYTNISNTNESYLEALQKSGTAKRSIPNIAPKRTALYVSYGFDSFTRFYENFKQVQQDNPKQFEEYQIGIEKLEKFLKINIEEHFISWIGDEIALLLIESQITKGRNDMALVLKTDDIDKARINLGFILDQIRKKTPVKFKTVSYKQHEINFLSIKGFFKILLGNRFKELDKPYFTLVDDYVIFSNDPNTLKSIINDIIAKNTLSTSPDFKDFTKGFKKKSSLFVYSNVPVLYNNMYALADGKTKSQMRKNKDFIICFPQVGLQMTPEDDVFQSRLIIDYQNVDEVKTRVQFQETSVKGSAQNQEVNETIFRLRPIYPNDLTAKRFIKKYATGAVQFEVELKDGLKHGRYTAYYPDGNEKMTGRFRKDIQVGTWRYFDKDGKPLLRKKF